MRVLLISHTCQSFGAGQPKADAIAEYPGVDLTVISPVRWKEYGRWRGFDAPRPGTRVSYRPLRPMWPWSGPAQWYLHWYPALSRLLREFRPQVIDLWEEPWGLVSAHAVWLARRLVPEAKIVTETEQNIGKVLPPPFESFRNFTLRRADYAIGRSEEAVNVLRSLGYVGPAEVVPNGVDAQLFRPLDREDCRRQVGVSGFTAGYVGRLVEEKGLMDFVDALAECPSMVRGILAGDGPLRPELERRIAELGLASRVRILPGRPMAELPVLMNALDVMVLPSHTTPRWKEQFGRVIIEAHACGTPVIGTDSGAIPRVIGPGGLVVPERQPSRLAATISRLAAQPGQARELGEQGRRQALRLYTWPAIASQMVGIYRACQEIRSR